MGVSHYDGLPDVGSGGGGGSSTFVGLSDTPGSLLPDQLLRVDSGGTILGFIPASDIISGIRYAWVDATERMNQAGMEEFQLGVQRDTGDVYRYASGSWSVFFNLNDGPSGGVAPQEANSATPVNITSDTFTLISGMTLTATATGIHTVEFSSDAFRAAGPTLSDIEYQIFVNGIAEADSFRTQRITGSKESISLSSQINLTATDVVEIQLRCVGSPTPTVTIGARAMTLVKE